MKLYDYYRSTASYRVRIALNLKGQQAEVLPIHLVNNGGEQHHEAYQSVNPHELVPTLSVENHHINQSIAIIEYLDETFPDNPLLPQAPIDKARVRAIALSIACDIHPLNNLRVLNYLKNNLNVSDEEKMTWYHHWLHVGFRAIEIQLKNLDRTNPVCFADKPTLADIVLIPQVYNAHRFKLPMDDYPLINEINAYCLSLKPFSEASP